MQSLRIKISLFINYFAFAILLNSSGIAILQVQNNFGVSKGAASWIDPCKDFSIAIASFLLASFITRVGYKRAMLVALGIVSTVCFIIPNVPSFLSIKLLFVAIGACFALIKMSVYSTIGLITKNEKEHISLMNFIESFFMIGNLCLYFIFSIYTSDKDPLSTSWMNAYYLIGGLSVVAFLLLFSARLDESAVKHENKSLFDEIGGMFSIFIKPVVITFIFAAFFYVLIEQSIQNFLPTFNREVLKLPTTLSIQMGSILAGATALGRFLAGIVMKKLNWLVVLLSCLFLAAAIILIAMPLAKNAGQHEITGWLNAPVAAYVFPLIGILLAPIYPAINSIILSSLPKEQHGYMSGWIIIFSAIGGTTGSLLTGYVFDKYGGQTAFYTALIPITILIVILILFKAIQKKYTENKN
ncbi:MAG: MFS transporter [Bacteroidetes bacterium]|nr:MFS transporter [Bacteroidota bacterium]